MKRYCWIPLVLCLSGCGLIEAFYKKDVNGNSTASTVQSIVRTLPYGEIIASAIGVIGLGYGGNRHIAHKKVKKENQILKARVPADQHPPAA